MNVIALIVTVSNMVKHNNLFFICITLLFPIAHLLFILPCPCLLYTSSNASVTAKRFYTLKKELDVVDDELDHLDDEFEHAYENGKLSFKVYKSLSLIHISLGDDFVLDSICEGLKHIQ